MGMNQEIRLRAGEPLHMPVPITGAPKPTVTWTKAGAPLPGNAQIADTEERTCVDIPRTVRGDSGEYKVKLANDYGEDEATIKVVVMGTFSRNSWSSLFPKTLIERVLYYSCITQESIMDSLTRELANRVRL